LLHTLVPLSTTGALPPLLTKKETCTVVALLLALVILPPLGAFQITYNGGYTDVSISKFNPYGTNLIYSTYLGGASRDNPHSLIVNHNNELLIFGTTQSINFPTTASYDFTPNGGYDIFVAKLSVNGNTLMGSTYVGGTADDGLNWGNPLKYNYADEYRGEIVVDENDFVFVASTTRSVRISLLPQV
jgi:hypothetical protein